MLSKGASNHTNIQTIDSHAVNVEWVTLDSPVSLDNPFDDGEFQNTEGLRNLFISCKLECSISYLLLYSKGASNHTNIQTEDSYAANADLDTTDSLFALDIQFANVENLDSESEG